MQGKKRASAGESQDSDVASSKVRLDARSAILSPCQNFSIIGTMIVVMCIMLVVSSFASDSLIYEKGNTYSCSADHLNKKMEELGEWDDEGKAFQ